MKKVSLPFTILLALTLVVEKAYSASPMEVPQLRPGFSSPEAFRREIQNLKGQNFKVAESDTFNEKAALSLPYRSVRNQFIGGTVMTAEGAELQAPGAKDRHDIDRILKELESKFRQPDSAINRHQDSRLLVAQLLVLRSFKGFITRAKDIFDNNRGDAQFARMSAITMLRFIVAGIDIYLPTEQWAAAFEYFTQPFYPKPRSGKRAHYQAWSKSSCQIRWAEQCYIGDVETFQLWLRKSFLPRLEDLHTVLLEGNYQTPIYSDNKLLFGTANFVSHKDRYLRLGEAERLLMLSAVQATQSSILGLNAYNLTGIFETLDTIAKKYGFEQTFRGRSGTAKDRFEAIKSAKGLFSFKSDQAPMARQYMKLSYERLKASLQNAYKAWKILDRTSGDDSTTSSQTLIDPRLAAPFNRIFNTAWPNMFGIMGINGGPNLNADNLSADEVASGEVLSAMVAGEKVRVNLKEFFHNPPRSLKDFMPTRFVRGREHLRNNVGEYRNYRRGNPVAWDLAVYQKYFEGVNNQEDIKRIARVLSQSWGGFLLGLPINLIMM